MIGRPLIDFLLFRHDENRWYFRYQIGKVLVGEGALSQIGHGFCPENFGGGNDFACEAKASVKRWDHQWRQQLNADTLITLAFAQSALPGQFQRPADSSSARRMMVNCC